MRCLISIWRARLERRARHGAGTRATPGRVTAAHRAAYDVQTATVSVRTPRCPDAGCTRTPTSRSATGSGSRDGLIRSVLPRRSALVRNAAGRRRRSADAGRERRRRVHRQLARAGSRAAAHRALPRDDLGERRDAGDRADEGRPHRGSVADGRRGRGRRARRAGARRQRGHGQGMDALRARIQPGTTAVLIGSSGVGKSTIVNAFVGARADGGEGDARRRRRGPAHDEPPRADLLPGGGVVIDTPGIRELQLWDAERGGRSSERSPTSKSWRPQCKFNDCTHRSEPGCAVLAAVERRARCRGPLAELVQAAARAACDRDPPDARLRTKRSASGSCSRRIGKARARRI